MMVKDIMEEKVLTIGPEITLKEAAKIMSQNNVGSMIVTNRKKIVGIITERDILKNISSLDEKVSSLMKKEIISIDFDNHIENAALLMTENKIKRLVVTNKDKLAGIITATDILAHSNFLNDDFFF